MSSFAINYPLQQLGTNTLYRLFSVYIYISLPSYHHSSIYINLSRMGDAAAANRSLSTIRTELEYLRESGMLRPEQYESITNQLPVRPTHTHTHIDTSIHSPPPSAPKFLHLTHSGRNRKAAVSQAPTSTHASPKGPTTSTCRSSRRQPRTPGIPPTRSIPR